MVSQVTGKIKIISQLPSNNITFDLLANERAVKFITAIIHCWNNGRVYLVINYGELSFYDDHTLRIPNS